MNIPYQEIDWENVKKIKFDGESGYAVWQTIQLDGLRLRLVEYSKNYLADHWCTLGHIVYCLEGEFESILENGKCSKISKGMTYIVSNDLSTHKSKSNNGCKLFIIDGNFLK